MRLSRKTTRIVRTARRSPFRSALFVELLEDRTVPSTLIPVTNHRDLVYDPVRGQLDITTSAGSVQRYDVASQTLLAPLAVGTSLNGADITPDGSSLYVTEGQTNTSTGQGLVHKVDLTSGAVTDLAFPLNYLEGGSWDLAVGSAGTALFDTMFNGSGWVPVRQINLATDAITTRNPAPAGINNTITQNTLIHRSADRGLFFFTESNISSGATFLYNAVTDTFSREFDTNTFLDNALSAVNRNGTLIALELNGGITILDRNFDTVKTLPGLAGGMVFDPVRDVLYAVNTATAQVAAYDTNTWAVKYQLAVGETVGASSAFGNGVMTVSSDGSLLFLATASGVRMFNLPAPAAGTQLVVGGFPMPTAAGAAGSFTVTAEDAQGNLLTGYTGTVHFTSSDARAVLPADYTFTAADQGTHTFPATLATTGAQSITATDTTTGTITGTQGNIFVTPGAASTLVLAGYPSPTTAGASHTFTVTARDAYGNVATGYTGAVHFTSSDGQAALPADYTFNATDAGVHTFSATLKTAGSQSLTATDKATAALTATQAGITVNPAAVSAFTVAGFPSPATAGVAGSFTVTARDAYGNVVPTYAGTVHFETTDFAAVVPANYTFTTNDAGSRTFSATLKTAGTRSITARDINNATISGTQSGITVVAAAPASLYFASPGDTVAGTAFTITVVARDAYGNVAPTYAGTVHFTSSDPQAVLPADYTFTAGDAGQHPFSVTLKTAAAPYPASGQSITVTDTSASNFTWTVYDRVRPAAASAYQVTAPAAVASGSPFGVTVTALDPYGNVATGYAGTVTFSSSDPSAVLPANYTFNANDQGRRSFPSKATFYTLGGQSVTATDAVNGAITATAAVTVNPEPAGLHFTVAPSVTTAVAGTAFDVTVTALDGSGNVAAGYTGTVHFTTSDPGSRYRLPADYTFTAADAGVHTFAAGVALVTVGTQTVTAADPGIPGGSSAGSAGVQITPAAPSVLSVTGFPSPTTAGAAGTFTVTARDVYGNLAPSYAGTVHFSSSDAQAVLPANYTFTSADQGVHAFTATLKTAGTQSLSATDTAQAMSPGRQTGITVTAAAAALLHVSTPTSSTAGSAFTVTVSSTDAYGNFASGYLGTVHFTSSDAQAVLPANYTFTAADAGSHTFTNGATLKTAGSQTITATDTATPSVTGTGGVSVSPGAYLYIYAYTTPVGLNTTAGQAFTITVQADDAYGNITPSFQGQVTWTSSDHQATLPSAYTFTASDQGKHVFTNATTLGTAGWQTVTAATFSPTSNSSSIISDNVAPAAASRLQVGAASSVTAGSAFNLTVTALDAFGNTATGYAGTVHFTSSDGRATVPGDYTFSASDAGVHTFTGGATLRTAGTQSVVARDVANGAITGSAFLTVKPAAASVLRVAAPASGTAGSAFGVTVTALDPYGNTATGYTGTVHFTSSDSQATLPADYTFTTSDAGVRAFANGVTLATAGNQTVTATDTAAASVTGGATVAVNPAGAVGFRLTSPAAATAGAAFSVTVTAIDAYGNTVSGYLGTVHFTSSDGRAALPADYTFTSADNSSHTFTNGVTLVTAGGQSVTVSAAGMAAASGTVTVGAAAAAGLSLAAPAASTAGAAFTVTVTAFDPYGNVATGYTGTVHFTSSDGQATLPADYAFTTTDAGVHTFANGATLDTAGTQSVTAVDAANALTTSATVLVSAAAASRLRVTAPAASTAGSSFDLTITALDPFNNVATGYRGTVALSSSDGRATLPASYGFTAGDAGVHTFTGGATLDTAGAQTITATDTAGSSVSGSVAVQVAAAAASALTMTGPGTATAGSALDVTVTARDAYGNVASGYTGTVHFSSSDGQATLPADYAFTATDAGVHTFAGGVTLDTTGSQTVTATDAAASAITGSAAIAVSPAAASHYVVSAPSAVTAGSAFTVTVTALDAFGNTATGYGGTVHFTSSDSRAALPADATLTAGTGTFSVTLKTAGTASVTATDAAAASITGTRAGIQVAPGAAASLGVTGFPSSVTAGTGGTVTVTAFDAYGNVATGYTGTVHITSSDGRAVLPGDYAFTAADAGVHGFSVTFKTAGGQSLTATDTATASLTGTEAGIQVNPAAAVLLRVTGPSAGTAGGALTFTVTALDAFGNTATGYTGTVHFTSSDGQAALPADYAFSAGDAGVHGFSVTFKTAGSQSLTATDTATASLTGTQAGIAISPAAASRLVLAGYPSPTTAGASHAFTVTARDAYGNVATGYTGTVHFASSDTQAVLPADYAFTAGDAGVHAFSATLKTAGSQALTAADTATASLTGTEAGIQVNPAAAALLRVTGPSAGTAGGALTFTVTALDAFGNTATGYTGTVHFTSSDGQAALPTDYTFTAGDAGVHGFNVTFKTAGSQSLTATDTATASITGTQAGIAISPAAASRLVLAGYPSPTTAGTSHAFTVTARDAYGNVATGYTGTVHFASSDPQAALPGNYTFTGSDQGVHSFSATLKTAGSQSLTATDAGTASLTGSQTGIAVTAAAAAGLTLAGFPTTVAAGTAGTFTVTARDAYGNIATGYTGTVSFSSTDAQAGLPAGYTFTAGDGGVHTFTATLKTAGSQGLTVKDVAGGFTGSQAGITVTAAAASRFVVAGYPSPVTAGTAHTFTVTVQDAYGNTVTGYAGTVAFTSSDAQAGLPGNYTFTSADQGVHTFSATLKTAGSQSLTVKDTAAPGLTGSETGITVVAAAATHFVISAPTSVKSGAAFTITVTAVDAYGNVASGYRGTVHFTSSDHKAQLPANYTFTAGDNGVHTFTIVLKTRGAQTVTVTDTLTSSITGQAGVQVN